MAKSKRKRRPSSEQGRNKGQVPQRGFKEAHVLAVVNKGQTKGEKRTSTKQKQTKRKCSVVSKMQGGIRFVQ